MPRTKSKNREDKDKRIRADANLFDLYLKIQHPESFLPGRYAITINSVRIAREGHAIAYATLEVKK